MRIPFRIDEKSDFEIGVASSQFSISFGRVAKKLTSHKSVLFLHHEKPLITQDCRKRSFKDRKQIVEAVFAVRCFGLTRSEGGHPELSRSYLATSELRAELSPTPALRKSLGQIVFFFRFKIAQTFINLFLKPTSYCLAS